MRPIRSASLIVGLILSLSAMSISQAQDGFVFQTFKDTRVINTQSIETLKRGHLDIRIGHRFGDMFGDFGGWETFYGFEQARDILIGANYGITDHFMIGLNRTKGSGDLKANLNGMAKLRFLRQNEDRNVPISAAVFGILTASTQKAAEEGSGVTAFTGFVDRLSFHTQFIVSRKFADFLSVQLGGGFTHRNRVKEGDDNDILNFSAAARIQITKVFGLILDANYALISETLDDIQNYPALGVGFEIETGGGHVFQINLTNATGLMETDYVPYTRSNWADGEYRIGFTISRQFKI